MADPLIELLFYLLLALMCYITIKIGLECL